MEGNASHTIATGDGYIFPTAYILSSNTTQQFKTISYKLKGWSYNGTLITNSNGKLLNNWNIESNVTLKAEYETTDANQILFGSYPQTKETNESTISTLTTKAGTLPTSTNVQSWTDYGYYINSSVASYMYYIDIDLDNNGTNDYRGVYFTEYRPLRTNISSNNGNSIQDDNGYNTNNVYWFKYEPVKWDILTQSDGKALIVTDLLLDSYEYNYTTSSKVVNSKTIYANNYAESSIRSWLNETFYNTVFNDLEKAIIETTTVDNSLASTGDTSNKYVCQNTNDKLFLLSVKEATTYYTSNDAREAQGTDYAKCQGLWVSTDSSYLGNSYWWLRSPYRNLGDCARHVGSDGSIGCDCVYFTEFGVRAACWINL